MMKLKILLFLIFLLFSANITTAKEFSWLKKIKQIKLLSQTREDINKLLGNPVNNEKENHLWYYDFPEGRMAIIYQTKMCVASPENSGKVVGWKVPEWTVVEVSFSPDESINYKKLGLNIKDFNAKPIVDVLGGVEYSNDELGIDITEYEGKIEDITFRPAKKYDYLQCKESDVK